MQYERFIQRVIDWIESHLFEEITIRDVAKIAGFSEYHFQRIFAEKVGLSTTEYIRIRRLTNAASMLIHTDERILDIAILFRFESQESFTRAFKKIYQLPPGRYRKTMRSMQLKEEVPIMEERIKGWFLSGSHPFNYEMGLDKEIVHQGTVSGYLKSTTVETSDEFATLMQQFKADHYKGKRIQLTGFIKTTDVENFASMWMRIDNSSEDILQFDNMSNRPIKGTNLWNRYSIVLDVPENSATISFGILLTGKGHVWIDSLHFEEVDLEVPTTNINITPKISNEPVNLSFED